MRLLLVCLGAAFGAPARYNLDLYIKKRHKYSVPFQTMVINILGSFILGLVIARHGDIPLFIGTGFAGAFTTWSTFAVESHKLFLARKRLHAIGYATATFLLCLASAALGIYLAK
jgi:CrcB protein